MIEEILSKLDKVRRTGPNNWLACCPAHGDKNPSMTLHAADDGRILVRCHTGCNFEEIVGATGLGWEPWFPPKPKSDFVPPIRRPFPAADVLEAVAEETMVVMVTAYRLGSDLPLLEGEKERLMVAYERICEARKQAFGSPPAPYHVARRVWLEEKRRGER